jgi:hypothetical protein
MAGIVPYVIWASIIITGLSLVAIVLFGLRNMTYGKMDPVTVAVIAVPFVLFLILGFVMDTWAEAAVMTFLILLVLTAFSLLLSSIRGLLGM